MHAYQCREGRHPQAGERRTNSGKRQVSDGFADRASRSRRRGHHGCHERRKSSPPPAALVSKPMRSNSGRYVIAPNSLSAVRKPTAIHAATAGIWNRLNGSIDSAARCSLTTSPIENNTQ